jgi:hypothetical protein
MASIPKVTVFGYEPGRAKVSCMFGEDHEAVPITIKGDRVGSGQIITGPSLWVRTTTSPYYAFPYMHGGEIGGVSGTTVLNFRDYANAVNHFKVGDVVNVLKFATGVISGGTTYNVESISTSGIVLSGTGFALAPVANDLAYVYSDATYGVHSALTNAGNICLVLEDIILVSGVDQFAAGYIKGTFLRDRVRNATFLASGAAETARIRAIDGTGTTIITGAYGNKLQFIDIVT